MLDILGATVKDKQAWTLEGVSNPCTKEAAVSDKKAGTVDGVCYPGIKKPTVSDK